MFVCLFYRVRHEIPQISVAVFEVIIVFFLQAIGRILTLDASDDQGRFEEFMIPFGTMFRQVNAEMSSPSQSNILQIKVGLWARCFIYEIT